MQVVLHVHLAREAYVLGEARLGRETGALGLLHLAGVAREHLDERSWYVLQRRYGLDGRQSLTLDALGRELGLSRESVRKIENQALARLQQQLAAA